MVPLSLKLPQTSWVAYKLALIMKYTTAFANSTFPSTSPLQPLQSFPAVTLIPMGPVPFPCSGF